jgi:ADP-heptose:LPS heptosyltransferase
VIRALKLSHPNLHVSFLTHPMGRLVLKDNPYLDEHLVIASGMMEQIKGLRHLRSRNFNIVFDFMGNPRSSLAAFCTGAKTRVGVSSARDFLYTQVVPRISGEDYIVLEKFRMINALGFDASDVRLDFPWDKNDLITPQNWLNLHSPASQAAPRIILSPTHRREARRWCDDKWVALATKLVDEFKASVIWAWGPGEEDEVSKLAGLCSRKTFKAPKTSLRELGALIGQCELFIGNSNGPSHIAVAVNTPSIQLHGPTDAPSWCPFTPRHAAVAKSSMASIDVPDVLDAVSQLKSSVYQEIAKRGRITSWEIARTERPQL